MQSLGRLSEIGNTKVQNSEVMKEVIEKILKFLEPYGFLAKNQSHFLLNLFKKMLIAASDMLLN